MLNFIKKLEKNSLFICLTLIILMIKAAFWQWDRYNEKLELIKILKNRFQSQILNIEDTVELNPNNLVFHRVKIKGNYDFNNEILIRNRKLEGTPGYHVITPVFIDNLRILVNRGFIPLKAAKSPELYQNDNEVDIIGLIRESNPRKSFLSPKDSQLSTKKLLRIDIDKISNLTKYELLPFYIEIIHDHENLENKIFYSGNGKNEILSLPSRLNVKTPTDDFGLLPIPIHETSLTPDRHYSYVFEWSFMALLTFLILFLVQMRHLRKFK